MNQLEIHVFPDEEIFIHVFDINKSFGDLKNELLEGKIINVNNYYFEVDDRIMLDSMILKDSGIRNYYRINVIRNDYLKIKVEIKKMKDETKIAKTYFPVNQLKVIKVNNNKVITVCNVNLCFIHCVFVFIFAIIISLRVKK